MPEKFKEQINKSDLKAKATLLIAGATFIGLLATNRVYSGRKTKIAVTERETGKTRENTKALIRANFNTTAEPPKPDKLPTAVEYVRTPLPRILDNPDAQKASILCQSIRNKCARIAEFQLPDPDENNTFMKNLLPTHLTKEVEESVIKIKDCERKLQNCVFKKVLPHRTQKR